MLRGGLIGGERLAERRAAWDGVEGTTLVAVCGDPFSKTANGALQRHDDVVSMLASERLDFVDIAGPIADRCSHVEAAALHKVAALCAPPFANEINAAKKAVSACNKAGVVLAVDHFMRFVPGIQALREALLDEAVGAVHYGHLRFRGGDASATDADAQNVRPLLAFNLLDLARVLLGEAERLHVRAQGEGLVTCALDHEEGAVGLVDWSFATVREAGPDPHVTARIEGDGGTLELDETGTLFRSGPGGRKTLFRPDDRETGHGPHGMTNLRRVFAEVLEDEDETEVSGEEHLRTLRLWQRVADSGKSGRAA